MSDKETTATELRRRRLGFRTAQLPVGSRLLYRLDHYSSLVGVVVGIAVVVIGLLLVGAALGFPQAWLTAFQVGTSAVTLLMVFVIQHTQGREQAATQRKLDELLKALPGAADTLMMLEEAPQEVMLEVEEEQRKIRTESESETETESESVSDSDDLSSSRLT